MKINEKTVLTSVALAIASVAVLWYMTISLQRYSEDDEVLESGRAENNETDKAEEIRIPPRLHDLESTPRSLPPSESDPTQIIPTL